ncbi:MAG: hypothetical protein H5U01_18240, partial [Clostridia bacterium]|nr:hypothetical protein [Clostridia bacterium]
MPELLELRDQVTQAEAAVSALQTVYPQFTERRRDWPTVLGAILEYDPQRIELKELFQTGAEITVVGLALTQEDVLNYAGSLDRAQIFERVLVQSMQNSEEALATPPPLALRTLAPARSPTAPRATELAPSPTVVVPGPSPSETPILSPLPEVTQTCL